MTIEALETAYERYKNGKGIGRQDMFGLIIDELKALTARIGSVDEVAVASIEKRVGSLETVIGNALRQSGENATPTPKRRPGRPSKAELAAREANHG